MNGKLSALILKLIIAAAALTTCVCAVAYYWEDIVKCYETSRKLYCHERLVRGHRYGKYSEFNDYADMDWENDTQ
jgi:hypothetical protein